MRSGDARLLRFFQRAEMPDGAILNVYAGRRRDSPQRILESIRAGHRRRDTELERIGADLKNGACVQCPLGDFLAVEADSVSAAEVAHPPPAERIAIDLRMMPRDGSPFEAQSRIGG